jgi:CHAT domain-containing protein
MERFYDLLRQGLSKAEALQRAQLHLLHMTAREVADFKRSQREEARAFAGLLSPTLSRDFKIGMDHGARADPERYSHPHFWAPFTLMGSWN